MKVQGGMFCDGCGVPVAAQKSTHRARNTASVLLAGATAGLSLWGLAAGEFHRPRCGGPVRGVDEPFDPRQHSGPPPCERFEPGREEGERRKFVAWYLQNRGRSEAAAGTAFKRWWQTGQVL